MNPYEILGIPQNASEKEIRAAWRKKSLESHPDRTDGDNEAQSALNVARDVLLDPDKRAKLDAGEVTTGFTVRQQAAQLIISWTTELAIDESYLAIPLDALMKSRIREYRVQNEVGKQEVTKDILLLEQRLLQAQKYSSADEENVFCAAINSMLKHCMEARRTIELQFEVLDEAENIVNSYTGE